MSAVFMDGFDYYNENGTGPLTIDKGWIIQTSSQASIIDIATGRRDGSKALFMNSQEDPGFTRALHRVTFNSMGYSIGFAYKQYEAPDSFNRLILSLFESKVSSTALLDFYLTFDGAFEVRQNGTLLGTSTAFLGLTWHYVEFSVGIHASQGTVKIYDKGSPILELTNLNTMGSGTGSFDFLQFSAKSGNTYYIDDLYVANTETPLGPCVVGIIEPESDVSAHTLDVQPSGTSYADALSLPVSATNYVYTATTGKDTFDMATLDMMAATVLAVQPVAFARKSQIGDKVLEMDLVTNETSYVVINEQMVNQSTAFYLHQGSTMAVNPNTLQPWTVEEINALQMSLGMGDQT